MVDSAKFFIDSVFIRKYRYMKNNLGAVKVKQVRSQ